MEGVREILDKISVEDMEKLSLLFSINNKSAAKEVVTLRVFCEEYRNLIRNNCSRNYYSSVNIALLHFTKFFSLQKPLQSITQKDVELFLIDLQRTAPKGYRVYYRTLKAAFNKAVDWSYLSINPFVKIKLQKRQTLKPKFINKDELEKILSYAEPQGVKDVIEFGYYTGLRLDEIVNIKWKNVDFESELIVVGDDEFVTKGKKQRVVPMSGEILRLLRKRQDSDCDSLSFSGHSLSVNTPLLTPLSRGEGLNSYVFGKGGDGSRVVARDRYTGDYFSKRFKRACRKAGMDEGIHFHSLRHSFASNMAQRGVSLYVIKELLGHSSIKTTETYAHLNVESLREAVDKLTEVRRQETEARIKNTDKKRSNGLRLVISPSTSSGTK